MFRKGLQNDVIKNCRRFMKKKNVNKDLQKSGFQIDAKRNRQNLAKRNILWQRFTK